MTTQSTINFLINLASEYGHTITAEQAQKAHDIITANIDDEDEYYAEAKSYFAN